MSALCVRAAIAAATIVTATQVSFALAESQRDLRLIIPCPAGSQNDLLARAIAQLLSEKLGQQTGVENSATPADETTVRDRNENRDEGIIFFKLADCGDEDKRAPPVVTQK